MEKDYRGYCLKCSRIHSVTKKHVYIEYADTRDFSPPTDIHRLNRPAHELEGFPVKKEYLYEARIVRVIDGDTVRADVDLGFRLTARLPLRIRDLDTPEIYRPKSEEEKIAGMKARDVAVELLIPYDADGNPLDQVVLITTYPDAGIYGRWSASITLPDGRDFATVMRELGHHVDKE